MAAHSKSFVVFLALSGHQPAVSSGVRRALDIGTYVTVVTDRRKLPSLASALEADDLLGPHTRLEGIPAQPLERLRERLRQLIPRFAGGIARRLHRLSLAALRSTRVSLAVVETVDAKGLSAVKRVRRSADTLALNVVEPSVTALGSLLTRIRQLRHVNRIVADHVRHGRLIGVVAVDSASLLPGWLIGRRYKVIPVVTAFPTDWDSVVVEQLAAMETGSTW